MSRDERGASLITMLAVSAIVLMLAAVMLTSVGRLSASSGRDRTRTESFHVAEAGIDRALSQLASNPSFPGDSGVVTAGGQTVGSYATTVTTPAGAPDDRLIVSEGTPAAGTGTRRVALTVRLVPIGSFEFPHKSASSLTAGSTLVVTGPTYATSALSLPAHTSLVGDVISPANITTGSSTTINGLVWSGGNVVIASGATVNGNVYASGTVTVSGAVTGDVRAQSIVVSGGSVAGTQTPGAGVLGPATRSLPAFTYNPADYVAPVTMTAAAFNSYWALNRTAMSGTFYINDPTAVIVGPALRTTLTGDLRIITTGRIVLQSDFASLAGASRRLSLISTAACCAVDAIAWTGTTILPPSIQVFAYTTGLIRLTGAKTIRGVIEAQRIIEPSSMTLTYEPAFAFQPPPGFTWNTASAGAFDVRPGVWRDCSATGWSC